MSLIATLLPALLAIAIAALVVRFGRDAQTVRLSPPDAIAAHQAATRVQRRNRFALVVGLLAAVAAGVLGVGLPTDGRMALLAPMVGAGVAMLVFVLVPSAEFLESDAVRTAELSPRRARDYARVWPVYALCALTVVVIAALGLSGHGDGRTIGHDYGQQASVWAGPYPGWFFGVPVLVATVVLAALTDLALRRVARAPRPSDPSLRDADEAVRSLAVRVIVGICAASVLVSIGSALTAAGAATLIASGGVAASLVGGPDASIPAYAPLQAVGVIELVVGIAALAGGLAILVLGVRLATRAPFRVGVPA